MAPGVFGGRLKMQSPRVDEFAVFFFSSIHSDAMPKCCIQVVDRGKKGEPPSSCLPREPGTQQAKKENNQTSPSVCLPLNSAPPLKLGQVSKNDSRFLQFRNSGFNRERRRQGEDKQRKEIRKRKTIQQPIHQSIKPGGRRAPIIASSSESSINQPTNQSVKPNPNSSSTVSRILREALPSALQAQREGQTDESSYAESHKKTNAARTNFPLLFSNPDELFTQPHQTKRKARQGGGYHREDQPAAKCKATQGNARSPGREGRERHP